MSAKYCEKLLRRHGYAWSLCCWPGIGPRRTSQPESARICARLHEGRNRRAQQATEVACRAQLAAGLAAFMPASPGPPAIHGRGTQSGCLVVRMLEIIVRVVPLVRPADGQPPRYSLWHPTFSAFLRIKCLSQMEKRDCSFP